MMPNGTVNPITLCNEGVIKLSYQKSSHALAISLNYSAFNRLSLQGTISL